MRSIAIIANIILLGVSVLLVIDGVGELDVVLVLVLSVFVITPVLSITALMRSSSRRLQKGWISLWFKRKALEEKKKIEELSNRQNC